MRCNVIPIILRHGNVDDRNHILNSLASVYALDAIETKVAKWIRTGNSNIYGSDGENYFG